MIGGNAPGSELSVGGEDAAKGESGSLRMEAMPMN
jgi:hypothetical protein